MARTLTGVVSSEKADKTIVVTVATRKTHPLYKKQYTSSKKFMAHDEANDAHLGDKVTISETKPLSKRKRFTLDKVVERAPIRHVEAVPEIIAKSSEPKEKSKKAEKPSAKDSKESVSEEKP